MIILGVAHTQISRMRAAINLNEPEIDFKRVWTLKTVTQLERETWVTVFNVFYLFYPVYIYI